MRLRPQEQPRCCPAALLLLVPVLVPVTNWTAATKPAVERRRVVEQRAGWRAWEASLAAAVAHAAPLTVLDGSQLRAQEAGLGSAAMVRRTQLPSWTLHVVEAECAECLDSAMHAAGVRRRCAERERPPWRAAADGGGVRGCLGDAAAAWRRSGDRGAELLRASR
ncbi:hypothetical protein N2W54_001591 [Lotmaria passim]